MRISELRIHPIKSTKHISTTSCEVLSHGIKFDREWALFGADDQVITAREYPKLLDISCQIKDERITISVGEEQIAVPEPDYNAYHSLHVFSYNAHGYGISKRIDEWFSDYLGIPCRLMRVSLDHTRSVLPKHGGRAKDIVGFGDQAPVLILSEASLNELNGRLEEPIGMERFRPNFIISDTEPYAEDHWDIITIGNVQFRIIQQCERCILTTIDNTHKLKHPKGEPLKTLSKYRKGPRGGVVFGVHAVPLHLGTVNLNDKIEVISSIHRPLAANGL